MISAADGRRWRCGHIRGARRGKTGDVVCYVEDFFPSCNEGDGGISAADVDRAVDDCPLQSLASLLVCKGTVLGGFGDVAGADLIGTGQIGDGAGDLEGAVVGTGRELQTIDGAF